MSVLTFKEIHDGRDADYSTARAGSVRRYTRVFRATTSSNTDEGSVVLAHPSCPGEGEPYPWDPAAYCQRVRARNESFSKTVWVVTAEYSNEIEIEANPLNDPADIDWNSEMFQSPAEKDKDGKGIVNAAGDPFDPPAMKDDARWVATVRKNVVSVPSWLKSYRNAINNAAWSLDGMAIAAGQAKLSAIALSSLQERNDVYFRVLTMTFHVTDNAKGHLLEILNVGVNCKPSAESTDREPCKDKDGNPVSSPVQLAANGTQVSNPTSATANYIDAYVYNEKNFSVLPVT